jgi:RimJ/RimL family protein N-acetyltransferase
MPARVPWQIDTPRLTLIGPEPDLAEIVNEGVRAALPELRPWMPWAAEGAELEQTRSFLTQAALDFEARNCFHWNIALRDLAAPNGATVLCHENFIGCCGFPRLDWAVPMFEIGYWLRSDRTGRGYMTEAVQALTRLALDELGARRVEIRSSAANGASGRVAQRAGFALEATLRNHRRETDGTLSDTLIFALCR